ncbi:alpha-amylase [Myxococcota bacterium]|nr:alpha-amylase [Myxococcota bacterium]MBU1431089.1 alpha-amylase [Myxococcota bacterium]MBU1896533.1 alpha-amylase [Myxococcota bacterium]
MRRAALSLALLPLFTGCVTVDPDIAITSNVTDWRDEIIYQIMIDRFEDGDVNNNFNVDYRKEASYHGGDWQGLINRLDYIESLGVTALWISPVVRNVENDAGFASYHGYWTQDFLRVNPHFGDLNKLRELVEACHARGIKVILDIVTNHVGQLFYYDINRNGLPDVVFHGGGGPGPGSQTPDQPNPLRRSSEWDPEYDTRGVQGYTSLGENGLAPLVWMQQPDINRTPPNPIGFYNDDWYNRRGRVTVWEDNGQFYYDECRANGADHDACERYRFYRVREQEMLGDFPGGLKDLNTLNPETRQGLIEVFQYWIEAADFDGFRIDTLKHQEHEFFDEFAPAMRNFAASLGKKNFFMFGEAFDANDELLGSYTHGQGVDSVFYFSAKYWIFDGIFGQGGATRGAQELFEQRNAPLTLCADGVTWKRDLESCDPTKLVEVPRYNNLPKTNGPVDEQGAGLTSQQLLVNFIDNHDVPRFLFLYPNPAKLRAALIYLLMTDGIPCIYYGTEQDFSGGPDPSNREDMWVSDFKTSGETFKHIQKLIRIRKENVALRRGGMRFAWTTSHTGSEPDAGLMAFERIYGNEVVLVMINTREAPAQSAFGAEIMPTSFGPNALLEDIFNDGVTQTTDANGRLNVAVPPLSARVFRRAR